MSSPRKSVCIALGLLFAASASAQTFDASTRGSYSHIGAHSASNLASYAGQGAGTDRHRAFFVFDLGTLTRPVGSGVLRLEFEALLGPDAAEVFSVYDVTTNVDELLASQSNRADIYSDLGSGVYYGIAAAFASAAGTVIEVPLEPDAIADINRAAGGRFAVGVFVETVRLSVGSEGVRFASGSEPRVHQLVLTEAPPTVYSLSVGPTVTALVPPAEHAVVAHLVDEAGTPIAGAPITFSVVSGPNTGAWLNAATDDAGAARYAYTSALHGADRIRASFSDGTGSPLEADALAFFDADCNANQIPDACDVACGGFDGECAAFTGCGGSADADANGVPDACSPPSVPNAAPDCSQAAILPAQLRRPDRQLHPVALDGVTDPDGDAVQLTIDAVHQDEPVDGFTCGSGKPDATGIGTDRASVRAESSERGDGRVYHVSFSADDGRGGVCSGTASVCVPRFGLRRRDGCVDQGPLYDSSVFNARKGHRWGGQRHGRH